MVGKREAWVYISDWVCPRLNDLSRRCTRQKTSKLRMRADLTSFRLGAAPAPLPAQGAVVQPFRLDPVLRPCCLCLEVVHMPGMARPQGPAMIANPPRPPCIRFHPPTLRLEATNRTTEFCVLLQPLLAPAVEHRVQHSLFCVQFSRYCGMMTK